MIEIDLIEDNIVYLSVVRARFKIGKCRHQKIEIDEDLAEVTCTACGERLNPIAVLARFDRVKAYRYAHGPERLTAALSASYSAPCARAWSASLSGRILLMTTRPATTDSQTRRKCATGSAASTACHSPGTGYGGPNYD
ncbi:MAG: hypothetical protein BVN35_09570 [Proteobacteria bacterium ST_bin11]|nr:MAG: hypothetical protein BVN35_09570 [Proteobacteria bacterium ST_bin11]